MTTKDYIDLVYSYPDRSMFYDDLPNLYNGEWTSGGGDWYPCVILDDDVGERFVKIVTRNQTHMRVLKDRVRRKDFVL